MPYIAWKTPLAMNVFRVGKFKQRAQLSQNPYVHREERRDGDSR